MDKSVVNGPGWLLLFLGVIYPSGVILFEWISRFCAGIFFDPLPTPGHLLLVLLVPVANGLLWWHLREERWRSLQLLHWMSSVAIGVAIYYSLIFLPLVPLGVIAVMFYGVGLLPLAPIAALVVAVILYKRFTRHHSQEMSSTSWWKGAGIGVLLLVLLDIPAATTTWGVNLASSPVENDRQFGLTVLRTIGDEDLLLRMCYDGSRQILGPWTLASAIFGHSAGGPSQLEAREIYYRVTGHPFNTVPLPYESGSWSRFDDFQFDSDLGGVQVGGRIRDLRLLSSRIEGFVNGDDGLAYMEWILEFQNDSSVQREARVQITLPPDAVVSRASLWIEGEEREAAFAKQSKVRAAYQRVVDRRRDPLLVTTAGPDRVLAQAFPIPERGGTIKFKLGITAPLKLISNEEGVLLLPAITDRNFNIVDGMKHAVWFEGRYPIRTQESPEQTGVQLPNDSVRWQAQLNDEELSLRRTNLVSRRNPAHVNSNASFNGTEVSQQLNVISREPSDAVLLVIDGSKALREHATAIERSLKHIPASLPVGFILASDANETVPLGPWNGKQEAQAAALIVEKNFKGGQDNTPALAKAITALDQYQRPLVIWVHGSQPVTFANSQALLEQAVDRSHRLPELVLLNLQAGPNNVLENAHWQWWARTWPSSNNTETALVQIFAHYLNGEAYYQFLREADITTSSPQTAGSSHLVRLWARDTINILMRASGDDNVDDALALANHFALVTPLSGAVVLENAAEYAENDLVPADSGVVPTIPEPGQWALIITVILMLLWLLKTRRISLV